MRKRRIILLLIAVGVLAAVLVAVFRREREPSYHGKRLSEWVEQAQAIAQARLIAIDGSEVVLVEPFGRGTKSEPSDAIQKIGTNALPYLLTWIQYEAPPWKTKFLMAINRTFHSALVDRKELRADRAANALTILGEKAEPAVPRLAAWINDPKSAMRRPRAGTTLVVLGVNLLSADNALMTNSHGRPFFTINRSETSASVVVIVLLRLLRHSDLTVRTGATNALRLIAPEALEKATGK